MWDGPLVWHDTEINKHHSSYYHFALLPVQHKKSPLDVDNKQKQQTTTQTGLRSKTIEAAGITNHKQVGTYL